jgi:hypothetical protein
MKATLGRATKNERMQLIENDFPELVQQRCSQFNRRVSYEMAKWKEGSGPVRTYIETALAQPYPPNRAIPTLAQCYWFVPKSVRHPGRAPPDIHEYCRNIRAVSLESERRG